MSKTKVVFYRESDAARFPVPRVGLDGFAATSLVKMPREIEPKSLGHEASPAEETMRDGIYELRIRLHRVNYRAVYFFHGKHRRPLFRRDQPRETSRARQEMTGLSSGLEGLFGHDPNAHTYEETLTHGPKSEV